MIRQLQNLRAPGRYTGTLVLLAVVLLWPSLGFGASESFLFPAGDGSCYDVEPLVNHSTIGAEAADVGESAPDTPDEAPCTTVDDDTDPSSNICYEAAKSQISTLPRLIAEANGKETADSVVNAILGRMDTTDLTVPEVAAITPNPEPLEADDSKVACSTHTEECRSLPPAPPTLQIDASTPTARNIELTLELTDAPDEDRINAWAHAQSGPRDGHSRLPERPPQAA